MNDQSEGQKNMSQEAIQDNTATPRVVVKRTTRTKRVRAQGFEGIEGLNRICKSIALAALLAVIGIGAFSRFYVAKFSYLPTTVALEQADIANQLRSGHGFTTKIGHSLALDRSAGPNRWYDVTYSPVYPYLLSMFFRVRGSADSSVALFNGLVHLLTGLLVYLIGARLRGPRTAILALVLYFLSMEAIGAALNGTGVTVATFFVTLAIWAALKSRDTLQSEDASPAAVYGWPALVGIIAGLGYLTGGITVLVILPIAALMAGGLKNSRQTWAVAVAAFALTLIPWTARNVMLTGTASPLLSQYKLMMGTDTYPAKSVLQKLPGETQMPVSFAFSHLGEMGAKFIKGLTGAYRNVPSFINPYLFPLVLLLGLWGTSSAAAKRVWVALLALLGLQLAIAALYDADTQYLGMLMPVGVCLATVAISGLIVERIQHVAWRGVVTAGVVAIVAFPYVTSLAFGGETPPRYTMDNLSQIRAALTDDAFVATDTPAAVSWYTGKAAMQLPFSVGNLEKLIGQGLDPDYIYMSRALTSEPRIEWVRMATGRDESGKADLLGQPVIVHPLRTGEFLFQRHNKLAEGVELRTEPAGKQPGADTTGQ